MRGVASCQPGFARGPLDGESDRGHCTHVADEEMEFLGTQGQYMSWGESCLLGYHFSHYAFVSVTVMGLQGCHACNRASLMAQTVKNSPGMQETQIQSLGWKYPLGEGHGNPLQYSCLENPMDRGAWWLTVHGATKSRT